MDYRKLGYGVLLNFFFVLTVIDLFTPNKPSKAPADDAELQEELLLDKTIPPPKMSSMPFTNTMGPAGHGPVIKFMFCSSCGYRKTFEQMRAGILERFPDVAIEGENYEPDLWRSQLAKALSYLKIGVIVMLSSGWNPFPTFGMEMPRFYSWAVSNKVQASLMTWFLTGMLETSLTSTGAFEIFYNDVQVWSKLENGRLPEYPEVLSIIIQHSDKAF